MALDRDKPETRHWTDLIAIVTGVALLGWAIWPGGHRMGQGVAEEIDYPGGRWVLWIVTGAAAIGAVAIAQRWRNRGLARAMLAASGIALLAFLLFVNDFTARAVLPLALPGILLLIASAGVGPMPRTVHADTNAAGTSRGPAGRDAGDAHLDRSIERAREREVSRDVPRDVVIARPVDAPATAPLTDEERRRRAAEHDLNGPLGP
jgi:hypothetical protein